jgi:hypothetical protein
MKLELFHLIGYLPHKLTVRVEDYRRDYVGREFDQVIGIHQWDTRGELWSVLTEGGAKPAVDKIKPILKDMSELTREELEEVGFNSHIDYLTYENQGVEWTLKAPFAMVQYLLSEHYDIYRLIPEGLAIDVNDLVN